MAGAVDLFRNTTGDWLLGYSRRIGITTILVAELWAVRDGLHLARDRGFRNLELSIDSLQIVTSLLDSKTPTPSPIFTLLLDCRSLRNKFWTVRIRHIHREMSRVTDRMAKGTVLQTVDFAIHSFAPNYVHQLLFLDVNELSTLRHVGSSVSSNSVTLFDCVITPASVHTTIV
ncbi:hypothetical protein ACH5RR_010748 [Cinchona calisaya]|uniref:RNase H type-1 domain-containing protein n=1 Tax=Cinchona calisaya TaxID=153742 RepID=A0ABD3AJY8_9GENT